MVALIVNGTRQDIAVDPNQPLLWAIRENLKLTGTKFGCGIAQCGACTVHVDGVPVRSCSTPVAFAEGKQITTIEGIASPDGTLHALQQSWINNQVPQCGYCQSGQIMSAVALLETTPRPTDDDIDTAMRGNICRCGMYSRIRKAIKEAALTLPEPAPEAVDAEGEINE